MAMRSIASLSLTFGLVSIPVTLYSATETASEVRFNLLAPDGSRVKQRYVAESTGEVVERSTITRVTSSRKTNSSCLRLTN
jgi:DNA end-binding protein Ku